MSDTTQDRARAVLDGTAPDAPDLSSEQRTAIEALLKAIEANRTASDAFAKDQAKAREVHKAEAFRLSEEGADLNVKLQAALPASPIAPQRAV